MVKFRSLHALANASPAVRLKNHVPKQRVVDVLLEHGGDPLQVRDGDDGAVGHLGAGAREQRKRLVDLAGMRVGCLVARVEL
jgi:hypothetical protein